MSGGSIAALIAMLVVGVLTLLISVFGPQFSRTTSDFYVASRRVAPWVNASAIAGEYLSAASFLGVAGLIVAFGQHGLWFPVGYTAGFLCLLVLVAAPLRRSGAYTIPDLMTLRFGSPTLRRLTAGVVVITGWLYIVPQFHGAALTFSRTTGLPGLFGPAMVIAIVLPTVFTGGMRSVTLTQAMQYWFKLAALLIPTVFIVMRLGPELSESSTLAALDAAFHTQLVGASLDSTYRTISLVLALMLGAVGLSHVLVRFYTNPDGASARRTTVILLGLLAGFYLLPVTLGIIARILLPTGTQGAEADSAILALPAELFGPVAADLLVAVIAGGAFAAFLSTAAGLTVSISGVVSQEFFGGSVSGFRLGAVVALAVPLVVTLSTAELGLAGTVAAVFTFTATAMAPVVLLSIWWPGITSMGAISGLITGTVLTLGSLLVGARMPDTEVWPGVLFAYPAVWTIPLTLAIILLVSALSTTGPPANTKQVLARLHLPEELRDS